MYFIALGKERKIQENKLIIKQVISVFRNSYLKGFNMAVAKVISPYFSSNFKY